MAAYANLFLPFPPLLAHSQPKCGRSLLQPDVPPPLHRAFPSWWTWLGPPSPSPSSENRSDPNHFPKSYSYCWHRHSHSSATGRRPPPTPVAPSVPPSVDDETSTERVEVDFLAAAVGTCGSVLAPTNPILVPALLVPLVDGTAVSFSPPPPSRLGSAKSSVDGIGAGLGFIAPCGESSCGAVCTVLVSRPVDARIIMGCGIWRIYLAILQSALQRSLQSCRLTRPFIHLRARFSSLGSSCLSCGWTRLVLCG